MPKRSTAKRMRVRDRKHCVHNFSVLKTTTLFIYTEGMAEMCARFCFAIQQIHTFGVARGWENRKNQNYFSPVSARYDCRYAF